MIFVYSTIIFIATLSGAIAGLGGGVIIKPLLDMIGYHDVSTIGFYSTVAVFTMCVVSILKQLKNGYQYNYSIILYISLGSFIGGIIGDSLLSLIIKSLNNQSVKLIQCLLLMMMLIVLLIYTLNKDKIKTLQIKHPLIIIISGFILGCTSIFLGIGGGPLNIALLMILFSFNMKESTIYSIATIFFSQISKMIPLLISKEYLLYDLTFIPFIMISAIIGGYVGTLLNQKMKSSTIQKFYIILMIILIIISLYNVIECI